MKREDYPYLDDKVFELIEKAIANDQSFDERQFKRWIQKFEIQNKNNPSAFVYKCFSKELAKGTFEKGEDEYVAIQPIINDMRSKGIKVTGRTMDISVTLDYLWNNQVVTIDELRQLSKEVIDTLYEYKDTMTSENYVDVLKKSPILAGRYIDWVAIGKETLDAEAEWDRLMKELEKR